ncbi:MAG: hypothetical protein ACI3ZT_09215 [Candidatus Cryptobacteroides sp.]
MKKILVEILLALSVIMISGCGKIGDIRITSARLVQITPSGLRGVKAIVEAGVDNPSMTFTVSDISGTVYYKGARYVDFEAAEPIVVKKKTSGLHTVEVNGRVSDGVSLLSVLSLARNFDMNQASVDIEASVKAKGMKKKISLKQVPLNKLAGKIKL